MAKKHASSTVLTRSERQRKKSYSYWARICICFAGSFRKVSCRSVETIYVCHTLVKALHANDGRQVLVTRVPARGSMKKVDFVGEPGGPQNPQESSAQTRQRMGVVGVFSRVQLPRPILPELPHRVRNVRRVG